MNALAPTQSAGQTTAVTAARLMANTLDHGSKKDVKGTFQDFVAGTFYKEMMKSMRKMHGKPAYFYGGQSEQIFQGQMDQQVAEDLAHNNGSQMSDSLYQAFLRTGRA